MPSKWLISLVLSISFILSACNASNKEETTPPPTVEKPRIALVMKTLTNPFYVTMERGAREAEKDFNIELLVKTAAKETSINQQIDIVQELVREKKVSAIVIAPGDSVQLIPVLKAAQDQGIKVVNIDNQLDLAFSEKHGLSEVPFISVDNEGAAYLSAKHISDRINTYTKTVILEGIPTAANGEARKAGAMRAFSENTNVDVIASESAHWKIDEGYEVIKSLFAVTPDIGAIFCANDMMAMGVLRYLAETERSEVVVAAFDAIDDAKAAVRAGKLAVTIDQRPARQGYLGVQIAVDMLNGKKPPAKTYIDVLVVDQSAVE